MSGNHGNRHRSDRQRVVSDRQKVQRKRQVWMMALGILMAVAALVLALWWRLQGGTTVLQPTLISPDPVLTNEPVEPEEPDPKPPSSTAERLPTWMQPGEAIELSSSPPPMPERDDDSDDARPIPDNAPAILALHLVDQQTDAVLAVIEDQARYPMSLVAGREVNIRAVVDEVPGMHVHFTYNGKDMLEDAATYDVFGDRVEPDEAITTGRHAAYARACVGTEGVTVRHRPCAGLGGARIKWIFHVDRDDEVGPVRQRPSNGIPAPQVTAVELIDNATKTVIALLEDGASVSRERTAGRTLNIRFQLSDMERGNVHGVLDGEVIWEGIPPFECFGNVVGDGEGLAAGEHDLQLMPCGATGHRNRDSSLCKGTHGDPVTLRFRIE